MCGFIDVPAAISDNVVHSDRYLLINVLGAKSGNDNHGTLFNGAQMDGKGIPFALEVSFFHVYPYVL